MGFMKEGWPNLAVWVTYRHLAGALCMKASILVFAS